MQPQKIIKGAAISPKIDYLSQRAKVVFVIKNHFTLSPNFWQHICVWLHKCGVMHVQKEDAFICVKMCVFSSLVTDTCCIISTGCQSQLPSLSRILQSNEIYFVCQAFQEADTFSLRHHQNMTFVVVMPKTCLVRIPNNINVALDIVCQWDIAVTVSIMFYASFRSPNPFH